MRHLAAILALLAGCGDNLAGPVAIADYPAAVREAVCEQLARCGEIESVATCLATNIGLTVAFEPSEVAAVDDGKIAYRGDLARSCVDALAGASCDVTSAAQRGIPAACQAILEGRLHDADACAFDGECSSHRCDVPGCGTACCAGRCVGDAAPARAGLGAACGAAGCAAGLRCDPAAHQCAPLRPRGAACDAFADCDYGLLCAQHTCETPPGPGQPCSDGCRDAGWTCNSMSHTCVAVGLVGATCGIAASPSDCSPVYRCDRTSRCSAGIALGQPCGLGDTCAGLDAFCDTALDGGAGVCALPRSDGAPCTKDAGCTSLHCDPFTLRCATPAICL
jgi:hypothetical protein